MLYVLCMCIALYRVVCVLRMGGRLNSLTVMLARAEKRELGGVQAIYRRRRTEIEFSDGKCWLRRFRRLLRSRFRRTDWAEIGLFADEVRSGDIRAMGAAAMRTRRCTNKSSTPLAWYQRSCHCCPPDDVS